MGCFDDVSGKLGFGLMRLPRCGEDIDVSQTSDMVDIFLDAGFNYFDTAWAYNGSEEAARKALIDRYPRERYLLATKLSAWLKCETAKEAQRQLSDSLERTHAGYFDYYLLHNLGSIRTEAFDKFGIWDFVQEKKAEGVIRHIGISIHDNAQTLDSVLSAHPEIEFVQLQVNYFDWNNPIHQSRACLEVASSHGKPVVVMEPLRGGLLAAPPKEVSDIFAAANPDESCTSWGLRFAASQKGVAVVLSGMSSIQQMEENVRTMAGFTTMTDAQMDVITAVQDKFEECDLVPCTGCNYCERTCPANIGISAALAALNAYTLFGQSKSEWLVGGDRRGKSKPSECLQCGACEQVCPQQIPIVSELKRTAALLNL